MAAAAPARSKSTKRRTPPFVRSPLSPAKSRDAKRADGEFLARQRSCSTPLLASSGRQSQCPTEREPMRALDLVRRMPWQSGSSDVEPLLAREWLVTNGLGGYAAGTVGGA